MGSPDNSKFNNQFGEKHIPIILTAVHCIFGFSALHPRFQCTEFSVSVHCLCGCKRLWEGMQTFAGRVVNVCGKGCKRLRDGL